MTTGHKAREKEKHTMYNFGRKNRF